MNDSRMAIAIAVAVFIAVLLLWRARRRSNHSATEGQQPFTGNVQSGTSATNVADAFAGNKSNIPPGNFEAEVRMLIDYGNKIAAIKVVREKLGLDLADAKDLVERMESGAPMPIDSNVAPVKTGGDPDFEARQLVQNGHLIEAIKLVRERKGLDLKAAKAYVERL